MQNLATKGMICPLARTINFDADDFLQVFLAEDVFILELEADFELELEEEAS